MSNKFKTAETAMSFIQAGNAIFTVRSTKTGNRFTYRVMESNDGQVFFVSVLSGQDNIGDYAYLGIISGGVFKRTAKSRIGEGAPSHLAFQWLYATLCTGNLPPTAEVWHCGHCGRCGRRLTIPESVETGYGPECVKLVGGQPSNLSAMGIAENVATGENNHVD